MRQMGAVESPLNLDDYPVDLQPDTPRIVNLFRLVNDGHWQPATASLKILVILCCFFSSPLAQMILK
jgi:hypothetical protein